MISPCKPLPFVRPSPSILQKPKRLPRRKTVTIAAAFACHDGIVIAADTKESYGESDHTYVNKIEVVQHITPPAHRPRTESAYAAIVGSGDGYLVDHIVGQIKNIFHANANAGLDVFRHALVELMPRLYASEAFTSYPHSDVTDLYTQLLVAARPNYREKAGLFLINSSLVDEVHSGVRIIGCGTMQEAAHELDVMNLDMSDSATAALYLIYEAKRHYSSVGGVTHVYSLPHPPSVPGPGQSPQVERVLDQGIKESLFAQLRGWHHRITLTVASPTISKESYALVMKSLPKDLRRIRKEFEALEKRERERNWENTKEQAKQFTKILEAGPPRKVDP